jgi:tetratricopeptide (TPR) repeat protein
VQSFLDEGLAALEEGNPQRAIDTWSRIFLIDGDNEEATARIEKAQLVKAEQERQLEELFAEAETFLEEDKPDEALVLLEKIVGLAPDHLAATEMIAELKDEEPSEEPEPDSEESDEAGALQAGALQEDAAQAVSVPPIPMLPTHGPPPVEAPTAPAPPVRRPFLSSNLRLILIGSGVLLLVALGAWMLSNNWSRLFPNSDSEPVVVRLPPDRIARLTALYDKGSVDQAIAALEKVQPDDPDYERAQLLLTEWQDSRAGDNEEEVDDATLDESRLATRQTILDQAREAYAADEYLNAARLFARASALGPLEGGQADLFEDAKRQLEPIAQMIDLYTQREYKLALPSMWRYFEEHPENRDIRLLLVNSHYNLAVRSLRGGQPEAAEALLDEAIKLDLGDANALRLFLFAKTYRVISRDLLYDIFVDNLEPRS